LREFEDDVDAAFVRGVIGRGIEIFAALLEELDRFADGCVAEVNTRDDDAVEFGGNRLGCARVTAEGFGGVGPAGLDSLAEGTVPCAVGQPEEARAGFVVGAAVIHGLLFLDAFHAGAGGFVVGINEKYLLVAFHGEVVAPRIEEPLGQIPD